MTDEIKELFAKGMIGRIRKDEDEDQWMLDTSCLAFGIEALLDDYEGKKVQIIIKGVADDGR